MVFFTTFSGIFSKEKIGGRAIIGFSGVGVRVTKGGYQILLGDCHTITVSSESNLLEEYRRG